MPSDRGAETATRPESPQIVPFESASDPSAAPSVAGYDLVRVLGQGGMGVVWEAVEHRFDRRVALKVHRYGGATENDVASLWAEAFVAARIGDPGIVRVLDVGRTLDERPYYAMELVEGTDLAALLADGPLAPRQAVAITADIARAVAAAHEHGVIHRDLKPRNIIIDPSGRARVVDFGVAFNVHAGPDPFAGQLAGSPAYMAPEQVLGKAVVPQTDIFAIGVILHQLLTAERPFEGPSTEEILGAILTATPPPPSSKNRAVHEDLDAIVARCLMKSPDERYPSARALAERLSAIGEGKTIDVAPASAVRAYAPKSAPPRAPSDRPSRDDAKKHLSWTWKIGAPPSVVWPFVANTDRFNKAVGVAPAEFWDEPREGGGSIRTGEMHVMGLTVRWREYPFEWIKDREHSVFRWYKSGPISALWNRVSLSPADDGAATELRHDVWVTPRSVLGQVAAFLEIDRKLAPSFDRFYRRLDEVLSRGETADPFERPHEPTSEQRAAIDEACRKLHDAGFAAAIVERLAMHLQTAPDGVLSALRPYELADTWQVDRSELLDALIHAAHAGVVEPAWDVVCPKCLLAHESVPELSRVTRVGTCHACASSFERDLRDSIELVFLPHPKIRRIQRATYCAGAPALRPHVIAQQVLDAGEERRLEVDLPRGEYLVTASANRAPWQLVASAVGFEGSCDVTVKSDRVEGRPDLVRAGRVTLSLRNLTGDEETVRVEVAGGRADGVSAAQALTHPSFRAFFSEQLLARGEHLRVSQLAFVFVELTSREALFEQLGDGAACDELTRLDRLVNEEARAHEGTIIPSSLDLFAVGFSTAVRAIRAALAIRARVDADPLPVSVAIAAHDGRCLALTREGKPEFFGETLERGQALLRECPPGGIALSASFVADRSVAVTMHESGMAAHVGKAHAGPYAGRRVTLLTPA